MPRSVDPAQAGFFTKENVNAWVDYAQVSFLSFTDTCRPLEGEPTKKKISKAICLFSTATFISLNLQLLFSALGCWITLLTIMVISYLASKPDSGKVVGSALAS